MGDVFPPIFAGLSSALAASDFDWFKLIPFGIAVVIWIVGAIAKSLENATKRPSQPWSGDAPAQPGAAYEPPPPIPQQYAPPPAIPSQWSAPPVPPGHWPQPMQWAQADQQWSGVPAVPSHAAPPRQVRAAPAPPPITGRKTKSKKKRKAPAVPPVEVSPYEVPPPLREKVADATTATTAAGRASAGPALDAAAIRRWLTPATLQRQYVLTELFDPPPSARADGSSANRPSIS